MLYKSTLRLLIVETDTKELLVPIVTNSYKKTLWLLQHREPTAKTIGIIEGPFSDINFMHVGEIDIPMLHSQILRTTNALYISIGKQPTHVDTFDLDYSLSLNDFVLKYGKRFTPDELLIILGVSHHKLFKTIGRLVLNAELVYSPENGQGKWSYYDYYWLNEKYKGEDAKDLNIKPYLNRSNLQIRQRAHAVGFTAKHRKGKKIVSNIDVNIKAPVPTEKVELSEVERDYMISQISGIVFNIINNRI